LPDTVIDIPGFGPFASSGKAGAVLRPDPESVDLDDNDQWPERDILKFSAWMAFARHVIPLGAVPVHASAVVNDGGAVLFLGESGTGKSTHTRLWLEHIAGSWLLNDDSPVVRATPEGVVACGSPWSGKTHCYNPSVVPLRAMVRLSQAGENRITRLRGTQAIGAVWPSCPPQMTGDATLLTAMLSTVGRIISSVPVFKMDCLPDREAALIAHDAIKSSF
jgi:hypothetical protein